VRKTCFLFKEEVESNPSIKSSIFIFLIIQESKMKKLLTGCGCGSPENCKCGDNGGSCDDGACGGDKGGNGGGE
jgi:hypothetical protein